MSTLIIIGLSLLSLTMAVFQAPSPSPLAGGLATGENMVAVGSLALFLGIPVQGTVDIIKGATGASGGKLPLLGVMIGTIFAVLVQIASANPLSMQIVVLCFFAGLSAQLAAMAANTLKEKAEKSRDKMDNGGH